MSLSRVAVRRLYLRFSGSVFWLMYAKGVDSPTEMGVVAVCNETCVFRVHVNNMEDWKCFKRLTIKALEFAIVCWICSMQIKRLSISVYLDISIANLIVYIGAIVMKSLRSCGCGSVFSAAGLRLRQRMCILISFLILSLIQFIIIAIILSSYILWESIIATQSLILPFRYYQWRACSGSWGCERNSRPIVSAVVY